MQLTLHSEKNADRDRAIQHLHINNLFATHSSKSKHPMIAAVFTDENLLFFRVVVAIRTFVRYSLWVMILSSS